MPPPLSESDVEIGAMPLHHAKAARIAIGHALVCDAFREPANYSAACAVKAMLDYEIARAEKRAAAFAEYEESASFVSVETRDALT